MKILTKIFGTIIVMALVITFCQSQNIAYGESMRPKVKAKLNLMYPHATGRFIYNDKYVSDTTQELQINCHCDEAKGMIILVFDTAGNFLQKDLYFNSIDSLPAIILTYMKKNESQIDRFDFGHMVKSINNKGEISYIINMLKRSTAVYQDSENYILKFKSSGELISKEIVPQAQG